MSTIERETGYQFPSRRMAGPISHIQKKSDALVVELREALEREQVLLMEKQELSQRQIMLAEEFEHRMMNSLQMISSLLSLQSMSATMPEVVEQLKTASNRVAALGRVHHRLHLLDHEKMVEFTQYLKSLCEDLTGLLFEDRAGFSIVFEGEPAEIPTVFAIPLGFIVNELITNATKYAAGNITVRFNANSPINHSLSVLDDGPGLPEGFDPAKSKGLGMKIVRSLVKQIGGDLHIASGANGKGTGFTVTFNSHLHAVSGT